MIDYETGDMITAYNRDAKVTKVLESWLYVQWQDNSTLGIIPRSDL